MDNNKLKVVGGGVSFLEGLTLLFVGLKLTEVIDWSWFWVASPLIVQIAFAIIAALIAAAAVASTVKR